MIGGPAAIPFAALMYFVRKPVNKISGAAFDYGAQKLGLMPKPGQPNPQPVQQPNPQPVQPAPVQNSWNMSFSDYLAIQEANELDEGIGDFFGKMIGKAAGFIGGKATKYAANVGNMLKSSAGALMKFARENKLGIAKAAFMMAVGAVVGAGVGAAVNKVSAAIDGVTSSGIAPQQEVAALKSQLGDQSVTSPDASSYINPEPGNSITDPAAAGYVNHGDAGQDAASSAAAAATPNVQSGVDLSAIQAKDPYSWKLAAKKAFEDAHKNDPAFQTAYAQKFGRLAAMAEKFAKEQSILKFGR